MDNPYQQKTIKRLLIANRGEIACRIISACRKLGITSIAVYVEEDLGSSHVKEADEALCIGSISKSVINPHIDHQVLIETALQSRADAIHPGYGYLSENADFAAQITNSGMIFVGPGPDAITKLGNKRQAKDYLQEHAPKIPLIPGVGEGTQDSEYLLQQADRMGYPVLIKAAAGGGGKGMRIVYDRGSFVDSLLQAQSEGLRSFGSTDCLLEKYIERGKHVEVQMLGDCHGNVITLSDRECSIQRRHQKIIEEAPCPWLSPEVRIQMSEAAKQIGHLLRYESAGTVEFIVDVNTEKFYFLEVNTRIQVEHAITEEITGTDIVALQIFVACGGNLATLSEIQDIQPSGHAIECRLCAEDPENDFLPGSGDILQWGYDEPTAAGPCRTRIETAVWSGAQISVHFDPMIAKLVVWGPNRIRATQEMVKVLARLRCVGLKTNQLFLQSCLMHPAFQDLAYSTSFIGDHMVDLLRNPYCDAGQSSLDLAVVASLSARLGPPGASVSCVFGSISKGFRNQRYGGLPAEVNMVTQRGSTDVVAIDWLCSDKRVEERECIARLVQDLPLPVLDDKTPAVGSAVQTKYLRVRAAIISNDSIATKLTILSYKELMHSVVRGEVWQNQYISVLIADRKMEAYITSHSGTTYCHFPSLGTFFNYDMCTLLSWCEALRAPSRSLVLDSTKVYRSQMPCKVIRVVKSAGEIVKAGETMLVLESMKMEVSIKAAVDGNFKPHVLEGDAIDAEVLLCELE